ncbi:hypothetical protein J5N97_025757 [Dioscorea zingiberensis]|uniref:Uncharacterized protein n=1 Tax=Dioscorea zingiberensis TaxID=325984 RepID=A0A9D5C1D2_9LILI|nr:hypothetical protein J5N97_025757 [Dioscorea zingiberensis]
MKSFMGHLPCIYSEDLSLESSCTQRMFIDVLNLVLLVIYCLALIVFFLRSENRTNGNRTRNWFFMVVSACCAAASIVNFITAAWIVFDDKHGFMHWEWVVYSVRGLIWAGLAVSLNIHSSKLVKTISLIWWFSSSLLTSLINITAMVNGDGLSVIDWITWFVSLLLFFSAFRLIHINENSSENNLSEHLLVNQKCENETMFSNANLFSKLTFSWMNPLMSLGYAKSLNLDDIPSIDSEDDALVAYNAFTHAWHHERENNKSRIRNLAFFALARCYMKEMLLIGLYSFLKTISTSVQPLLLYALVQYSNNASGDLWGISLVLWLIVVKVVESVVQRHWFFDSRRYGMRMRSAVMAAVFQKQIKLSNAGRTRHSAGEIMNYISVDAYRLGEFPWWFHMAWSLPLQLCFSIAILFWTVGLGTLPGLVPLIICGVLNVPFGKMLQDYQEKFMVAQDERLRATSEVLSSMKIIKLQSWEEKFRNIVQFLRDIELKWLGEIQIKKSYGTALYWMSPTVVSAAILAGSAAMRTAPLNASTIFTILATLRLISEPVRMLPEVLSALIQVKVSLDRLDVFLLEDEIELADAKKNSRRTSDHTIVKIDNGVFSWDQSSIYPTLVSIDLNVYRGEKVAIVGPVGAGKSSWIQSGTIRDNILFGKSMNKKKYENAIKSCALDHDLDTFPYRDLTEIGQRGINLSGGQKQRIQLARAVYNDADVYLLDDPFSAVDAHTAAILFKECVLVALEKKTVIFVTHQIDFLDEVDRILVIENSQVKQAGKYEELLRSGMAFEKLVNAHQSAKVVLDYEGHVDGGFVGLSLSCALMLTSIQVFLTRWYSVLENSIISIERIKQYMHIQSEAPAIIDGNRPPQSWPHEGKIEFSELKVRYRPNSPLVLKGITCTFMAGQKIGVVGRTGSGKTTLISSLFRLVEPLSGAIFVDDLNICSIGLKDLRMKLSIIPQEPTLFKGSVRTNLDPLGLYSDNEIWEALEKCQLKHTISKLPALLDSPVSDDGENWSTGERQLFCLGRVLLRKNKILVLDEATASLDTATDAILQKIIRQEFSNCTVITVAHRVPTVTDSDRVMVLSYGNIVEFGKPAELLERKESYFSKLVEEYWSKCRVNNN